MLKLTRSFVLAVAGILCVRPLAGGQPDGHRFGEWPAINAMIHGHLQKNLNLDEKDFLIEVWVKPLPMLPAKSGYTPTACLQEGLRGRGRLRPELRKRRLNHVDALRQGDGTGQGSGIDGAQGPQHGRLELPRRRLPLGGELVFDPEPQTEGRSNRHKDRKVVFYLDGKVLKEFGDVNIGDMSNHDMLSVGYCEYVYNGQAHCQISRARIWKFPKGLPGDLDKAIASHNESPDKPAESLTAGAEYSAWTFTAANDNIKDHGITAMNFAMFPGATTPANP